MKLTIAQDSLCTSLGVVGRLASGRSTLPVLANVLLQATDEGLLRLSATDLELGVTCTVNCQVETPGAISVPARTLADLIATFPREPVCLNLNKPNLSLEVTSGSSKASLKGVSAEQFPPLPNHKESPCLQVPAGEFKAVVQRVVFAASSDQSRPILNGVLIVAEGRALTLAAADGFRLSESKIFLESPVAEPKRCVVPARSMVELAHVATDTGYLTISLPAKCGQIVFRLPGIELVSQLIEGSFPDYQPIVPQKYTTRLTVSTALLLKASRQAEIFARQNGKMARLVVKPGQVEVIGQSEETGLTSSKVDASIEGGNLEIGFNVLYLREALSAIRTPTVTLEATTSTSPGVFRPAGEEGFLHVLMPLHLSE